MDFSYEELDPYVTALNAAEEDLRDIRQQMAGAFPDNYATADLHAALMAAELLERNAQHLATYIRALRDVQNARVDALLTKAGV